MSALTRTDGNPTSSQLPTRTKRRKSLLPVNRPSSWRPVYPEQIDSKLPVNENGIRTDVTCELCGYEPVSKNRRQGRYDHLNTVHFMDKVAEAIPDFSSKKCPMEGCDFVGKDKWYLLRHYTMGHRKCDQWLKEALAEKGIEIDSIAVRPRAVPKRVKAKSKKPLIINQPSLVQEWLCKTCNLTFEERSHLMSHEKYVHDHGRNDKSWIDRHRCDICGRLFMNIRYVEAHKNSVHFKQKNFRCAICKKKFAYKKSIIQHTKQFHPGCDAKISKVETITLSITPSSEHTASTVKPPVQAVSKGPFITLNRKVQLAKSDREQKHPPCDEKINAMATSRESSSTSISTRPVISIGPFITSALKRRVQIIKPEKS